MWRRWIDPVEKKRVVKFSKIRTNDPRRQRKLAKKINGIEGRLLDRAPNQNGEAFDHWSVEFASTGGCSGLTAYRAAGSFG